MKLRSYNILLIVVIAIVIIMLLLLFPGDIAERNQLKRDLFKYLIELLLIVIAGGLLMQEYIRSHENNKGKREVKKDLFSRIIQAYMKVKKVRRVLEAGIQKTDTQKMIPYPIFETQMNNLIDAQLEFEVFKKKDVLLFKKIFSSSTSYKIMNDSTDKFEKNLNKICEEYQQNKFKEGIIDITSMKALYTFIYDTKHFKSNFSHYYDNIIEVFENEILEK